MRRFVSYVIAGILVVLMLDMIAPPVGLGLSPVGAATFTGDAGLQSVDRTHKADRIPVTTVSKQQPATRAPVLQGCEPAFSVLASSARANFARSCVG